MFCKTKKTNVHDVIVLVATSIGVDSSIPYKLDESYSYAERARHRQSASPEPAWCITLLQAHERKIQHQRVSRTNARVPKHEAIESSRRLLSCLCNDKNASSSARNSGLETRSSPCTRRNKLRYVWTASKSRRDSKRCERECRKRLKS